MCCTLVTSRSRMQFTSFIEPADRRPERNAVVTNFSVALQFLERLPDRIIIDLLHPDVVQLQQIDPVRFQSLQRRIGRARDRLRRKILRNFALAAAARFTVRDKIVADLCRDHDFIALIRESLRDQFFAQSISIGVGRIEERDAEIKRLVHERDRFALGEISPPAGRDRPEAEADLADLQVGIFVSAKAHCNGNLATENVEVNGDELPLWL